MMEKKKVFWAYPTVNSEAADFMASALSPEMQTQPLLPLQRLEQSDQMLDTAE